MLGESDEFEDIVQYSEDVFTDFEGVSFNAEFKGFKQLRYEDFAYPLVI